MSATSRGRIPTELLSFFRSIGGHSLLIKGDAGTGKTTLALQLIEELAEEQPDYYMSTRVSDEALYRQFPWLEEKAKRNQVLRMGRAFLSKTKIKLPHDPSSDPKLRVAKDLLRALSTPDSARVVARSELLKLEGQIEAGDIGREGALIKPELDEETMVLDIGAILPELELAYDVVEANLPKKTFMVLDSIDALAERYGFDPHRIMSTLQTDLVEKTGANITYVMETSAKNIYDYMGDGVVRLYNEQDDGRRVRELIIEKLRGQRVDRWKYPFTLVDGRLRVFENYWLKMPDEMEKHASVPDPSKESLSTGNPSLDQMLKGGLPRGSLALLEIGEGVPQECVRALEYVMIADFLSKRRGVVWFPLFAINYSVLERHMKRLVGKDNLPFLKILDKDSEITKGFDFVSVIEGSDATQDLRLNNLRYLLSSAQEPFLSVLGFDALESAYGPDLLPQVNVHMEAMKRTGSVVLAEATSDSACLKQLGHRAHIHLKLESLAGTVMLCGQKPHTTYHYLDFEGVKDKITPELVPLV
jgi:KaiC/GvpD/RAD55 family RecA-like ATPase